MFNCNQERARGLVNVLLASCSEDNYFLSNLYLSAAPTYLIVLKIDASNECIKDPCRAYINTYWKKNSY